MQAAGKRKQSGKDPVSSAQSESGSAAGPGLQNDPGEYNCFLNVIVQCLWHCTAFRDAFLNLPRKVVKVCLTAPTLLCSMHAEQFRTPLKTAKHPASTASQLRRMHGTRAGVSLPCVWGEG